MTPSPKIKSRIVVVGSVYYQQGDSEGVGFSASFARDLDTDEQHFGPRIVTIGEDWQPAPLGWLDKCSMLIIHNLEGTALQTRPTPEENAQINRHVIEASLNPGEPIAVISILPREAHRICAIYPASVKIRCRHDKAKCSIVAIPG